MSLYQTFKQKTRIELQKKLDKKNINEVPVVDKVIVSMWIGSLATRKGQKDFSDLESNLMKITGQKPVMIYSKKSISNFKLRDGMPVMLKVTLRRENAFAFLERFNKLVLPRVRDYEGLNARKFDWHGNFNMGFENQSLFPEIDPEEIKIPQGVQINISTTTSDDSEAKQLLESLWFIFKSK